MVTICRMNKISYFIYWKEFIYIVNKYVQDEEIMKKEKENAIDSYSFELKLH